MGSKLSKSGSKEGNDLSVKSHIPYQFLDTSKMLSSCVPNMIRIILKPQIVEQVPNFGPTSSLAFQRDERSLLFGAAYFSAFNDLSKRLSGEQPRELTGSGDNCYLIDLQTGEMERACKNSIRDIAVSSNQEYFAILVYTGYTHVQLWHNDTSLDCMVHPQVCRKLHLVEDVVQRSTVSHATCCSISPNGKWLVLAVCSNFFTIGNENHLEIYTFNKNKLDKKKNVPISNAGTYCTSPEFLIVKLEFSSDNKLLAAGTFAEQNSRVFLISTKSWVVIASIGKNVEHLSLVWSVFNPLSAHQLISLTKCGCLQKWDTSLLCEDLNQQVGVADKMYITNDITDGPGVMSCPKFSCDGNLFAVPLSDGSVIILDPNLFEIFWTIPCPNFQSELPLSNIPQYLEATSVCFSKSSEYLAVGYSGHTVSVWLLPRMHFTLKHFCRTKIISVCPPTLIQKLPIPEALKQYLLYQ